jgi:O-antigen ligase
MIALARSRLDRAFFALLADWLVVGVAIALPWSTTATGICIAAWLLVLLPTLDLSAIKREILTPAGGLPIALWCLGAIGMLWADVAWTARLGGLGGFNRLLAVPLLLAQYRRSENGCWVVCGFLISTALIAALSYVLVLTPGLTWRGGAPGVPVHDDIFQCSEFLICGFGAIGYAGLEIARQRWRAGLAFVAIAVFFLADFGLAAISRNSLAVAPVLAVFLGWRFFRWKGVLGGCLAAAIIGTGFWFASTGLRERVYSSFAELHDYRVYNKVTSFGEHLAFLQESMAITASAPIIGHGTGSITEEFRRVTAGQTGVAGEATVNPHNQTFAVAIQLGFVGALVLWAMWVAHFLLFRGAGLAAWLGTVVVTENIVSSTVHSHLFDFASGWLYVFGVGVLGGMALRHRTERGFTSVAVTK